jgi:hypothetical protein
MNQALYAHMNNKRKMKKKKILYMREKKKKTKPYGSHMPNVLIIGLFNYLNEIKILM